MSGRCCSLSFVLSLEDMLACSHPIDKLAQSAWHSGAGCTREKETLEAASETTCGGVQESQDAERCFGSYNGMRMLGDTGRRCFYIDEVRISLIFLCTLLLEI